jgi:hypothetical protein
LYDYTFFHGSAIVRLIQDPRTHNLELHHGNHCYIVNKKSCIFLKHSTKRLSPWQFTFLPEHLKEIAKTESEIKGFYLLLICNDDGVCCLYFQEVSQLILVGNMDQAKSIRVSRSTHEKYGVYGTDGELGYKIGNSDFPRKVLEMW